MNGDFEKGWKGRCPKCGQGDLFSGFFSLNIKKSCSACGLNFDFVDSGDGPAVLVMLAFGGFLTGGALFTYYSWSWPLWLVIIFWSGVSLVSLFYLLRKCKGLLIVNQFSKDAKEGKIDN